MEYFLNQELAIEVIINYNTIEVHEFLDKIKLALHDMILRKKYMLTFSIVC